jgi:hypothetical protein
MGASTVPCRPYDVRVAMNAPPAICRFCGWEGPAPGIHIENSTDITFTGAGITCPNCGRPADIVSGTYDFVGGVIRLVRDANLTLSQIEELRRAAKEARKTGQQPDAFVSAHPDLAPIVKLIIEQRPGRDWLVILLMVLAIVVPYLQNAKYHAEDRQQAAPPTPTTLVLTQGDLDAITRDVTATLRTSTAQKSPPAPRPKSQGSKPARKKRPGKQHGKNKRRHR